VQIYSVFSINLLLIDDFVMKGRNKWI